MCRCCSGSTMAARILRQRWCRRRRRRRWRCGCRTWRATRAHGGDVRAEHVGVWRHAWPSAAQPWPLALALRYYSCTKCWHIFVLPLKTIFLVRCCCWQYHACTCTVHVCTRAYSYLSHTCTSPPSYFLYLTPLYTSRKCRLTRLSNPSLCVCRFTPRYTKAILFKANRLEIFCHVNNITPTQRVANPSSPTFGRAPILTECAQCRCWHGLKRAGQGGRISGRKVSSVHVDVHV